MNESSGIAAWFNQYPEFITLLIIAMGWGVAILLRRAAVSAMDRVNRLATKWGGRAEPAVSSRFTSLLQLLVFWGVLLTSVVLGISVLGEGRIADWIDKPWSLLSHFLAALAILAVGHIVGLLARRLVLSLAGKSQAPALSRLAYALIIGIAAVTAIDQLGLNLTFITQLLLVLIAVFFAGLSLAFASGARTLVANLLAQGELGRYRAGDTG